MRGTALTLTCPRCGDQRPPADDRALVTCAKCGLTDTYERIVGPQAQHYVEDEVKKAFKGLG